MKNTNKTTTECVAARTGDLWDCGCRECARLQREAREQARRDGADE